MKKTKAPKVQIPAGNFRKLILHFNIDKTLVMRDSLGYNNTEFLIRQILSELIWGKEDITKTGEKVFKPEHKGLEYDKANVEEDLMSFREYLDYKYHPLNQEQYEQLLIEEKEEEERKEKEMKEKEEKLKEKQKQKDKKEEEKDEKKNEKIEEPKQKEILSLEDMNKKRYSQYIKELCEITEPNHAGFKFRRQYEDMRKKLKVDEKIQVDLGLKSENLKLDENNIKEDEPSPKFNELGEDVDRKDKFKRVFNNSYHNIILSFFAMMIALKKNKQDFAVVFRFFGQDICEVYKFIYEFNCFCDSLHPRYCGDYGYNKVKYDIEKDKKDFRIDLNTQEFVGVSFRSEEEKGEQMFFNTLEHPIFNNENDNNENNREEEIKNFYNEKNKPPCIGYNEIYLNLMDKLRQNCTFVILDDYNYYKTHDNSNGKLLLVDPYDLDTLQIFFDTEIKSNPDKINVIDVITKKKLDYDYVINRFLVNVEPYRAIVDMNYFNNKVEECINNRKEELLKMQGKNIFDKTEEEIDTVNEMKKIPKETYLEMTVMPLLYNALTQVEKIRPKDPISYIANFMLRNKNNAMMIKNIIKENSEMFSGEVLEEFKEKVEEENKNVENEENNNENNNKENEVKEGEEKK